MPRESGLFGDDDRTDEQAYQEGLQEGRDAGHGDDFGYEANRSIDRFSEDTFGDGRTSQEKAYDSGREDAGDEKSWW